MDPTGAPRPASSWTAARLRIGAAFSALILLAVVGFAFRAQIAQLFRPRPPCGQPMLQIGGATYKVEELTPKSGTDLGLPSGKDNVAFWLQGQSHAYLFALSPRAGRDAIQTFTGGDPLKITWGDCSTDEYTVASIRHAQAGTSEFLGETTAPVAIFIPQAGAADGWIVEAVRPEALVTSIPETPNPNTVLADISFLDQTLSADGSTLTLKIEIKNTGAHSIHLAASDISLAAEGSAPAAPTASEPALPLDIAPGASQALTLTFPKPAASTATFKLLDFSVDLYF